MFVERLVENDDVDVNDVCRHAFYSRGICKKEDLPQNLVSESALDAICNRRGDTVNGDIKVRLFLVGRDRLEGDAFKCGVWWRSRAFGSTCILNWLREEIYRIERGDWGSDTFNFDNVGFPRDFYVIHRKRILGRRDFHHAIILQNIFEERPRFSHINFGPDDCLVIIKKHPLLEVEENAIAYKHFAISR
jgi:hypothetical protein